MTVPDPLTVLTAQAARFKVPLAEVRDPSRHTRRVMAARRAYIAELDAASALTPRAMDLIGASPESVRWMREQPCPLTSDLATARRYARAVEEHGNYEAAARALGIRRATLRTKIGRVADLLAEPFDGGAPVRIDLRPAPRAWSAEEDALLRETAPLGRPAMLRALAAAGYDRTDAAVKDRATKLAVRIARTSQKAPDAVALEDEAHRSREAGESVEELRQRLSAEAGRRLTKNAVLGLVHRGKARAQATEAA